MRLVSCTQDGGNEKREGLSIFLDAVSFVKFKKHCTKTMRLPRSKRKQPPVKTRSTPAPVLAAHNACHVCRINNVGLHFYDAPEWMLRSHLSVEGSSQNYDSARDKRAEYATCKLSHSTVTEMCGTVQPIRRNAWMQWLKAFERTTKVKRKYSYLSRKILKSK